MCFEQDFGSHLSILSVHVSSKWVECYSQKVNLDVWHFLNSLKKWVQKWVFVTYSLLFKWQRLVFRIWMLPPKPKIDKAAMNLSKKEGFHFYVHDHSTQIYSSIAYSLVIISSCTIPDWIRPLIKLMLLHHTIAGDEEKMFHVSFMGREAFTPWQVPKCLSVRGEVFTWFHDVTY